MEILILIFLVILIVINLKNNTKNDDKINKDNIEKSQNELIQKMKK